MRRVNVGGENCRERDRPGNRQVDLPNQDYQGLANCDQTDKSRLDQLQAERVPGQEICAGHHAKHVYGRQN